MKPIPFRNLRATATLATLVLSTALPMTSAQATTLSSDDLRSVAPALDRYARERLAGDLWKRPDLSPRDQRGDRDQAAVARREVGALPQVAGEALAGIAVEGRRDASKIVRGKGRGVGRFHLKCGDENERRQGGGRYQVSE